MHPIENIMKTSMEQIKGMVDVNTIVGSPIMPGDGEMVLPISKVCLGFLSGGGEYGSNARIRQSGVEADGTGAYPFAGAAAVGMSISPMAFFSAKSGNYRVMPVHYDSFIDRIIGAVTEVIDTALNKDSSGNSPTQANNNG